jgi:hypothetical protein
MANDARRGKADKHPAYDPRTLRFIPARALPFYRGIEPYMDNDLSVPDHVSDMRASSIPKVTTE